MNEVSTGAETLGDIVAQFPGASDVFKKHNVDFCCGGDRKLVTAVKDKDLKEELLEELNNSYRRSLEAGNSGADWREKPFSDLVDYIINRHHGYLNTALPVLGELTTTILRVHGVNHKELARVHKLLGTLKMDLEQHLIIEEAVLFPLIEEYEKSGSLEHLQEAIEIIEQVEEEHEGAGDILKELRQITADYHLPDDACKTFARTYERLQELESDLFEHIHLENNILHRRLADRLRMKRSN